MAQDTMQQPVDIGSKTFSFTYTDTKNTTGYANDYYTDRPANDVCYKFTLTRTMHVAIDHCGSEVLDTYVHLLDANGNLIAQNDDDWEYEYCSNPMNSYLYFESLPAGTYYVVSEGYWENGNITTTIQGIGISEVGSSLTTPVDIGNKAYSFEFTDTKNTTNYVNNYVGKVTNDVFYKFSISTAMDVEISHCGSEVGDTYLHLLNASGARIAYNDDYSGAGQCYNRLHSYIKTNLSAGTYSVVSEGYSQNGNITTAIKGTCPLPASGLYDGSAVTKPENNDKNYMLTITPTVGVSDVSGLGVDASLQTVQYFDGLGRPIETVQRGITPTKSDLATFTEYDDVGRDAIQWLPIANPGNGAFVELSTFKQGSSLYSDDVRPFTETIYEPSPLNRVTEQYGAGNAWKTADKKSQIAYQTNIASEVIDFRVVNGQLTRQGYHAENSLYKTENKDEDGKPMYEYKDKQDQVVLKRSQSAANINICTYYVYNDLEQLSYVIPPIAVDSLPGAGAIDDNNGVLKRYAYLYKYDDRGNCIEKRLPGCDPIYMVYDKADRLILSQDGNQREITATKTTKQWTVTKYDVIGRILYTGLINRDITDSEKATINNTVVTEMYDGTTTFKNTGYSCSALPAILTDITPLVVNYYNDYSFLSKLSSTVKKPLAYDAGKEQEYGKQYGSAKGLLTGTRTYILDNSGTYITTALYYDSRGRVVQTRSTNFQGGYDMSYNSYDFTGKVLKTLKNHSTGGGLPVNELYTYSYDHAGRLKDTNYKLDDYETVTLSSNSYDELGRLTNKLRHNSADTEAFEYNIRNWTTKIKSGLFEENLYYNTNPLNSYPCFNGNISYSTWTYEGVRKGYNYRYDDLNRLTFAYFKQESSAQVNGSYDEHFTYDKQGNVKTLKRKRNNAYIDYLSMWYVGNQVKSIMDQMIQPKQYNTKEYQNKVVNTNGNNAEMLYEDKNGNMTTDLDREIVTIRYNILNLPEIIQFKYGNQIINKYSATGQKLLTEYYTLITPLTIPLAAGEIRYGAGPVTITGTVYVDNKEYNISEGNNILNKIYNPEGYVLLEDDLTIFNYYRKDHLGNNREVWQASYLSGCCTNVAAATVQQTQYYPSGLPWATNTNDNASLQGRKYNGKEFVEMHGYDTYDYGARGYYPALGRFTSMDPLAEKRYSISPYAYCSGNPVNRIDPDGRDEFLLIWATANGEFGHAALAISNYNDKNKPNGTYTFYELGPGKGASLGLSNFNQNVNAHYSTENSNNQDVRKSELTSNIKDNSSLSAYENGAANGIIQIKTNYSQDSRAKTALENWETKNPEYNGVKNNCSVYAAVGISAAIGKVIDAREVIKTSDHIVKTYTPNNLYKEVSKMSNTTVIQNPGNSVNNNFLDGKAGSLGKYITKYW